MAMIFSFDHMTDENREYIVLYLMFLLSSCKIKEPPKWCWSPRLAIIKTGIEGARGEPLQSAPILNSFNLYGVEAISSILATLTEMYLDIIWDLFP